MDLFRLDEDIHHSRIIVTIDNECDHQLILKIVESMIGKLKDDVMGSLLKYQVLIVVWKDGGKKCSLVDVDKAREAVNSTKKVDKIWDNSKSIVKTSEFDKLWIISQIPEEYQQVIQLLPNGKSNHVFILHSTLLSSTNTLIKSLSNEITKYGVKSTTDMKSIETINKEIDLSVCVMLYIDDNVFNIDKIEDIIHTKFFS